MQLQRILILVLCFWSCSKKTSAQKELTIADPTIFLHKGTYYLYGTSPESGQGFLVYTSKDLMNWSNPVGATRGMALSKEHTFGTTGFWAPQVFHYRDKFYMAYTANEQLAIAVSDNPLGPFRQSEKKQLSGEGKQIDPFLFQDEDGTWYMYHVRLNNGNRIYVVKMKPDLSDIEPGTAKEILAAEKPWENTWNANWPVAEGPTVIKRSGKYYLMYSTNDFRNPDYAVGYAVSDHPEGPFVKSDDSPIINRKILGVSGPGHGDLFTTTDGKFKYVLHTHFDRTKVAPRLGAIIDIKFEQGDVNEKIVADPTSFRYLKTAIAQTFRNPLLPSGADPFSYWKDGYYYYTHTLVDRISLWKTKTLSGLTGAKEVTVFRPPSIASYAKDIWAPEIHTIDNKWYIYFSAADNKGRNNRIYVLENKRKDPTRGKWKMKGKIAASSDYWAIDGNVFEYQGKQYMIWSGWENEKSRHQNIYIATMKNPWTISGDRVCISKPELEWERIGKRNEPTDTATVFVNEGPQSLIRNEQLFVVYSASGCWTDNYVLGMLRLKGSMNPMDASAWEKTPQPVFSGSAEAGIFSPGHNSFFKSPDGRQDWILYHANDRPGMGCAQYRSPRAQRFRWKADGSPDFGKPVPLKNPLMVPSAISIQNN